MVLVEFIIGVKMKHFDDVIAILKAHGVKPVHVEDYTHAVFGEEPAVCIKCIADKHVDMRELTDHFNYKIYDIIMMAN